MYNKQTLIYSLSLRVDRPHLFNKNSRKGYSESDYLMKFWGTVFESYFYSNE
ncbi:hypothetical protein CLU79DRAFT_760823 [Phycomyces nitens]|nr:hypothetical protein CLU79DRAFT_760823 [Phycomyces nitens]